MCGKILVDASLACTNTEDKWGSAFICVWKETNIKWTYMPSAAVLVARKQCISHGRNMFEICKGDIAPSEKVSFNLSFILAWKLKLGRVSENYIVDLGVVMSHTAKFHCQNKKAAADGRSRAGWICRVFNTRVRCEMLTLYKVLVLHLLEYCCPLWSPTELGRIRELENVQRSFTIRIDGLEDLNYWERLKDLKLYSLDRRREMYCIIYVWTILNDLAPNFKGGLKIVRVYNSERNGITCVVPRTVPHATQKMETFRKNTLRIRGIKLFNKLHVELRQSCIGSDWEEPKRINKFKS